MGAETFSIEGQGDSLDVFSRAYQTFHTDAGDESVDKQMVLVAQRADFGLRIYQSTQKFRGESLVRGIVIGDTAFTLYREVNGSGERRPPGAAAGPPVRDGRAAVRAVRPDLSRASRQRSFDDAGRSR